MKCKKILSMLLALCMVLTTFVAVSAEDVVVVDINEDYGSGIGDTICGGDISLAAVGMEGENVLEVTSSYSGAAGWQSLVGFAVTDTEETQLTIADLPEDGVIEYSFDIYVPEGANVGDASFYLRTADSFPPAGMQTGLNELNGLTTGTWQTFEGTKNVSDCNWAGTSGQNSPVWICLRPNFSAAGTFYVDNVSFTLTQAVVEDGDDEYIPVAGDIEFTLAAKNVAGTFDDDGVYTVTSEQMHDYAGDTADFSNCSANDWMKIIPTTELDPEKTIKVSFDIKAENLVNSAGAPYADRPVRLRIRDAQNGSVVPWDTYAATVAVNTGVAQLVEFEIPVAEIAGLDHFGVNIDMQNPTRFGDGTEYFEISNVVIEYVGDDSEEPPVEDEDAIAFTAEATSGWIDEEDGVFTLTAADVYANLNVNTANPYTGFVIVIPETPIAADSEWTLTYDLTTNGVVDADNQGNTWLRLLDNTTTATQGKTIGYVQQVNSYADGTRTLTFTSDAIVSGGGTSTATEIAAINITVDMAQVWAAYGEAANDGVFTISNITLVSGLPSDEEGGEDPIVPGPGGDDDDDEPEDPTDPTYVAVVDIANDFGTDIGDVQVGTTNIAGEIVDLEDEKVLKVTSTGTTSHNGIIGIQLKDAEGNSVKIKDLADYDRVTWSVDLMMENTAALPVAGDGAYFGLRYGSWTPSNAMANLSNFGGNNLTAGQWKTISGSKMVGELPWQSTAFDGDVYFFIRPNFTGVTTMYVDNISIVVEKEFVPTIVGITAEDAGADNATFNVETDGAIDIDSLADYVTIDGVEIDAARVSVEAVDDTNTLVTVIGLAPGTTYEFAVTGAKNLRDRDVTVAEDVDAVGFTTIAEVDAEASLSGDTVTFSLTNNLSETETIHVVLLRCKGNTAIETIATEVVAEPGEPVEDSIEVTALGSGEYYRVFAWSYEDGAINSMANLIDLD